MYCLIQRQTSLSDHAGAVWYKVKGAAIGQAGDDEGIRAAPTTRMAEEMIMIVTRKIFLFGVGSPLGLCHRESLIR